MSAVKPKAFMFYESYCQAIWDLGRKNRLELYDAITKFAFCGDEAVLSPINTTLFKLIKPTIKSSLKSYEAISDKYKIIKEFHKKNSEENPEKESSVSLYDKEKEKENEKNKEKKKEIVQGGQYARKNAERVGKKYISRYNYDGSRKLDWEIEAERNMPDLNSMFDTLEDFDI